MIAPYFNQGSMLHLASGKAVFCIYSAKDILNMIDAHVEHIAT